MKISSTDVRSLLLRLNDEIQIGTGKIMVGPMSFAQSLGESIVFGGASAFERKMATAGNDVAGKVVSSAESSATQAADCGPATDAVLKNEVKIPKQPIEPGVEDGAQVKGMKAAGAMEIVPGGVPVEKTDHTAASLLGPKNEVEAAKKKLEHKQRNSGIGNDISIESKAAAIDPAGQMVPTTTAAIDVQTLQPAPAGISNDETATELSPGTQDARKLSNRPMLRSAVPGAKTMVAKEEGRKGKDLAANADPDAVQTMDASDSRQGLAVEAGEKPLSSAKSDKGNPSIHVASSSFAPTVTMPQPMTAAHGLTQTKISSPADVSTAMQNHNAPELPQATVQDHRIFNATASMIEVGMASGPHGWLKIRAEMTDAGTVKAAIASSSMAEQEMLHRDLPLLSNFLEQERIPVSSLVVHQTTLSSGIGAGLGDGGGTAGHSRGENAGNQDKLQNFGNANDLVVPEGLLDIRPDNLAITNGVGGNWLNVRA